MKLTCFWHSCPERYADVASDFVFVEHQITEFNTYDVQRLTECHAPSLISMRTNEWICIKLKIKSLWENVATLLQNLHNCIAAILKSWIKSISWTKKIIQLAFEFQRIHTYLAVAAFRTYKVQGQVDPLHEETIWENWTVKGNFVQKLLLLSHGVNIHNNQLNQLSRARRSCNDFDTEKKL